MEYHLQDVWISRQTRSADRRTVSAVAHTDFKFYYEQQWVEVRHKSEIEVHVRPHAPERRVLKKLKAAAWADACSYMDGNDVSDENIFSDIWDAPPQTHLSDEQEYELQEELAEIAREISPASKAT